MGMAHRTWSPGLGTELELGFGWLTLTRSELKRGMRICEYTMEMWNEDEIGMENKYELATLATLLPSADAYAFCRLVCCCWLDSENVPLNFEIYIVRIDWSIYLCLCIFDDHCRWFTVTNPIYWNLPFVIEQSQPLCIVFNWLSLFGVHYNSITI